MVDRVWAQKICINYIHIYIYIYVYIHVFAYVYVYTKPRNKIRAYAAAAFFDKTKHAHETIEIPSDFDAVL